jgi:thiamine-phosphate pyrophosphorylase
MPAERPQIYLVTPPAFEPAAFGPRLAAVLDAVPVACLRLALATTREEALIRTADTVREIAHARDVPLVIERHVAVVERLGLDGVHLPDGARGVRKARAALGAEAIVGAFCATSRHEGITAGEAGADYISFGPVGGGLLGDGATAPHDLFAWWSDIIEVPVVAEGGLTPALVASLAPVADFLAVGEEIWGADDPAAALKALLGPLG